MKRFYLVVCGALLGAACGGSTERGTGAGGSAGSGATGGSAGSGATGGSAGSGATGGSAGSAGAGGSAGSGATGGSAGSGATGGSAGSAGAGGSGASPECTKDADCTLWSDCCSCIGLSPGEKHPTPCPNTCIQGACMAMGVKNASCVAGRCVAGYDCDSAKVTCKVAVPVCPTGQVPRVKGSCYTGECVPADECSIVTGCGACNANGLSCALYVTQVGKQAHCVTVPKQCGGNSTCSCLGPSVCVSPYNNCNDFSGVKGVSCDCPAC